MPSRNKSDKFSEHSLELYVDVVRKLIETLNPKNVVLSGHSLGGAVIQSYYFKYPSDVNALILIGTGGRLRVKPSIFETLKRNFQGYVDGIEDAFCKKPSKKIIEDLKNDQLKTDPKVISDDLKICDEFDTLDKTALIDIPCLILVGKEDDMTPVKYSQFFHDKIKRSELKIIEKAKHLVMFEKPKQVNRAIESFINK